MNVHEDVMFNLSNMFCGYNEKRVWNFIPYVGIGVSTKWNEGKNADIYYTAGLLHTPFPPNLMAVSTFFIIGSVLKI